MSVNTTNTEIEITSCINLSCHILNGPPFKLLPIRLAGTMSVYSKKAIAQLNKIMVIIPEFLNIGKSLNRKWPYQAMVINVLEAISNKIVVMERDIINPCIF